MAYWLMKTLSSDSRYLKSLMIGTHRSIAGCKGTDAVASVC